MLHFPLAQVTGKEKTSPSGTPYDPSEGTAIEVHSPLVPFTQSLICSRAAFPAEAADDNFLASIISAPLFPTLGWKNPSTHSWSKASKVDYPLCLVLVNIGTMVGEWLPQIPNWVKF